MIARRIALLAGPLIVAGCASGEPGVPLGPEDVQRELVGKIWTVRLPDGSEATEWFNEDGSVVIRGGLNDAAHWRLSDNGYCTRWQRMRQGAERCFTLERAPNGDIRIYRPEGAVSMTIIGFRTDNPTP